MNIDNFIILLLIAIVFVIIIMLIRKINADKKEKRIAFYALESLKDNSIPLNDKIMDSYFTFIHNSRKVLLKINYFKRKAKKYEKYVKYKYRDKIVPIDFITNKVLIMLVFIVLAIISGVFTSGITIFMLVLDAIVGYYLLDIFLIIYYKRQTKLINNELLRAIIVMNNAFKAGRSTLQALKIASLELPEPISDEFKKMYLDMKYGLSVEAVFDRFAKRVNLEEATYLSSSLTILNRTGGNIVEVFSSIERTLFDKQKLNEELKNISAGPNMIIKVLFIIPIAFILIVYLLNPTYFDPLFSCTLGYMILGMIVLMFIIYVLLLKRITKIDI